MTIFYIHGFASSAQSKTARLFEELDSVRCLSYDSNKSFQDNLKDLSQQFSDLSESIEDPVIAGTSLGGFYAKVLAEKFQCKCVMINPAVKPSETLAQWIGENTNFGTGEKFILTKETVDSYSCVDFKEQNAPTVIFVSSCDEVIPDNDKAVLKTFGDSCKVIVTRTPHRIQELSESMKSEIVGFMNSIFL